MEDKTMKMGEYTLRLTYDHVFGGVGYEVYEVENFNGDREVLQKAIKEWNDKAGFWEDARIRHCDEESATVEITYDSKD